MHWCIALNKNTLYFYKRYKNRLNESNLSWPDNNNKYHVNTHLRCEKKTTSKEMFDLWWPSKAVLSPFGWGSGVATVFIFEHVQSAPETDAIRRRPWATPQPPSIFATDIQLFWYFFHWYAPPWIRRNFCN